MRRPATRLSPNFKPVFVDVAVPCSGKTSVADRLALVARRLASPGDGLVEDVVAEGVRHRLRVMVDGVGHMRDDRVGTIVEREADLDALPPIEATLPVESGEAGQVVPVSLRAHVTEIGTLELECADAKGRAWKVEFNLRGEGAPERAAPPA